MLVILVKVLIAMKRHHDYRNSYKANKENISLRWWCTASEVQSIIIMARSMGDTGRCATGYVVKGPAS